MLTPNDFYNLLYRTYGEQTLTFNKLIPIEELSKQIIHENPEIETFGDLLADKIYDLKLIKTEKMFPNKKIQNQEININIKYSICLFGEKNNLVGGLELITIYSPYEWFSKIENPADFNEIKSTIKLEQSKGKTGFELTNASIIYNTSKNEFKNGRLGFPNKHLINMNE